MYSMSLKRSPYRLTIAQRAGVASGDLHFNEQTVGALKALRSFFHATEDEVLRPREAVLPVLPKERYER